MDPRELFSFFKRRCASLFAVSAIVFFGAWAISAQTLEPTQDALVFITVGMDVENGQGQAIILSDNLDEILDSFTETVQGWLFNPAFLDNLQDQLGFSVSLTARKQEKQNILVTLSLPSDVSTASADPEALVVTTAETFLALLSEEMDQYNAQTHASFVVALHSITPMQSSPAYALTVVVSTILAFIGVTVFLLLVEYVKARVTFLSQVERELGKKPIKVVESARPVMLTQIPAFRERFFPEIKQNIVVAPAVESFSKLAVHHYPEDLKSIDPEKETLLWVRLGQSSESQLQELKSLLGDRFEYVVTY
jgi:capsular polysaccharide biosynthesis protein